MSLSVFVGKLFPTGSNKVTVSLQVIVIQTLIKCNVMLPVQMGKTKELNPLLERFVFAHILINGRLPEFINHF